MLGLGLGMAGAGMLMNQMQGNPYKGVQGDLAQYQKSVMGGWEYAPGGSPWDILRGKFDRKWVPGRTAPQAGPAQTAQTSGFRNNQADLINRLEALSKGQGPSLASEQLRQATERNMSQQASIAQTGRGNAALAGITAANNSAALGQQAASDSATARIAEQQMALSLLGQNIGQGRGQDQDLSQFNALQQNFRDQFNVEAQLRARGLDDEAIARILGMKMGVAQANQQGSMGNQLMAGGAGLLSMWGSNQGKKGS